MPTTVTYSGCTDCCGGVDPCCEADTMPDPITVELNSGAYSFTLNQTGFTAGAAVWSGSVTVGGCPIGFSVTQSCPDGFVVEMLDNVMVPATDTVTATSCSPLDISSTIDLSATASCLPAITQISITA